MKNISFFNPRRRWYIKRSFAFFGWTFNERNMATDSPEHHITEGSD